MQVLMYMHMYMVDVQVCIMYVHARVYVSTHSRSSLCISLCIRLPEIM